MSRRRIEFLDIVIPFCLVYLSVLCFWTYFIKGAPEGNIFDVITLTIISFIFVYGLIALIRDIKHLGAKGILTSWRDAIK